MRDCCEGGDTLVSCWLSMVSKEKPEGNCSSCLNGPELLYVGLHGVFDNASADDAAGNFPSAKAPKEGTSTEEGVRSQEESKSKKLASERSGEVVYESAM